VDPHCPFLLDFEDCHFHFDVVFTTKVFTYLYKYLYKGPDIASFSIETEHETLPDDPPSVNEVTDYQKGRYLSAPESAWRLLGFDITRKEPAVESLPIHLPGENVPQFRQHDGIRSSTSLLLRYFLRADELSHLRYEEYFEQFVLYPFSPNDPINDRDFPEKSRTGVIRRKASRCIRHEKIARINCVPIHCGEPFYLQALLLHRPASSFSDLRTIEGIEFPTFHEAAADIGLFANENKGLLTMREAVDSHRTPTQLHFLFAQIVMEGYAAMPLWIKFRTQLSVDHFVRLQDGLSAFDATLENIEHTLSHSGKHLHQFGLPSPAVHSQEVADEVLFLRCNRDTHRADSERMYDMLNEEQQNVFTLLWDSIQQCRPMTAFVEGRPGRGKTFLLNALCTALRAHQHIVLIIGTSALSAISFERGRTAHYMFGIPVTDNHVNICSNVHLFSPRGDLIRKVSAIIWDELPMANKADIECVHELCCIITRHFDLPFGGKTFIGTGDFRQVAPVVYGAGEFATLAASVKSSHLWATFQIFTLSMSIRGINDLEYTAFVDRVGEQSSPARQSLPLLCCTTNVEDAIPFLFPPDILQQPLACLDRAFLSPRNIFVDEFNNKILDSLPGDFGMSCIYSFCSSYCLNNT
jgi:hypothetical protein